MKNVRTARRYARALMALSTHQKAMDRVAEDLRAVKAAIEGSPEFRGFLSNPVIKEAQKKDLMRRLFAEKISPITQEFLNALCTKKRENILAEIIEAFNGLRDEVLGLVPAEVVTVVELSPEQVQLITKKLRIITGREPRLQFRKDPALIGGLVIRIGDMVIDGSVRHQLSKLSRRFREPEA